MYALDHVVHYVKDPKHAISKMKKLGLHAVEGGEHPNWGTYNSLCYFGLSYIEFLGIKDANLAGSIRNQPLVERVVADSAHGEGLSQIALRTYDIKKTAKHLKNHGFHLIGPVPGKRTRNDGTVMEWQLLFPQRTSYSGPPLPFFIQWNDKDEDREADLMQQGATGVHDASLSSVGFAVHDLDKRVDEWCRWFDLDAGEKNENDRLGSTCQPMHADGVDLLFCEPHRHREGPTMKVLRTRSEAPFLITCSNTQMTKAVHTMDAVYCFQP